MSKLDRLVGVKVFGWSIVTDSDGEPIWSNDCGTPLAFQYASAPVKFGPNFSTEIAAAWEVVEHVKLKYREGRCCVAVSRTAAGNPDYAYDCEVCERMYVADGWATNAHTVMANARTAPMSICLAALRAVGVPESEIQEAMR